MFSSKQFSTSSSNLRWYGLFNLILLALLCAWFWQKNQNIITPDAILPADNKVQCISYAPYYGKDQTPFKIDTHISTTQIDDDLAKISKISHCVRIYSVGQGLDYVPEAASKIGLKVLLGAWIGWTPADNEKEVTLLIKLAKQYPETIKGLIIGNEVLLRGEQTEATLQKYIERVKAETKIPVTYADVWEFWLKHKNLAKSVDFVTVHILPYWENDPQPVEHAIQHASIVMDKVSNTFQKPILIGETGWPSIGRQREESIPSPTNQARYIREFLREADAKHWNYNLIEAVDQPWKRELEGTVGGFWGIYNTELQPKFNYTGPITERHDGLTPLFFGLVGSAILLLVSIVLGERRPFALFNMAILGSLTGAIALLQVENLNTSCGNGELISAFTCVQAAGRPLFSVIQLLEWFYFGGAVLVGLIVLLCFPSLMFKPSAQSNNVIRISLLLLLLGAITAGLLLIFDGRYRDFPVIIDGFIAIQLSIGLRIANINITYPKQPYMALGLSTLLAAIICYSIEPTNWNAIYWIAVTLLLGIACGPRKQRNIN
jgi:exo-beta-1,3-glucanase (GH17 family)